MANHDKHEHEHDKKADTPAPVATAPPPEPPAPYPAPGYPKVVFATKQHLPPVIVNNDAELGALDPAQWTTIPPAEKKEGEDTWPKLYANVNLPPVIVNSAADAARLSGDWREFVFPNYSQPKK